MQGSGHPASNAAGEGGGAMFSEEEGRLSPVAFSSGMPRGFRLSRLLDPRSVREAMAAPDTDGWKDAVDREI